MIADAYKLKIGDAAPAFSGLPGVDGRTYGLDSFKDDKALLVVFSCNHCPYVQAYEGRMKALHQDYKGRGLGFIAINSNDVNEYPEDSFDEMKARAQRLGFGFPYVWDESQEVAEAYGAQCTPHVLIFDAKRRLAYQGRFDHHKDDPAKGGALEARQALDAILAGKPAPVPVTHAFGCGIKWGPAHFKRVAPAKA
jgi:peroxiredoxin